MVLLWVLVEAEQEKKKKTAQTSSATTHAMLICDDQGKERCPVAQ